MDFKALRAARNEKADRLIKGSEGKVDSSTWTPDEPLETTAKTGARPISPRAFKAGGKVDGDEAKTNLSRAGRKPSTPDSIQNRNLKEANEERDGVKHVGGFKKGGTVTSDAAGDAGGRIAKAKAGAVDDVGSSEPDGMPEPEFKPAPPPAGMMRPKKRPEVNPTTGDFETPQETQKRLNSYSGYKKGGMAKKKYEGSPKDNMIDAKMAKKKGMTHAEWEASPEDKRMDAKGQREMRKDGGHVKGCMCKACGGGAYKRGGSIKDDVVERDTIKAARGKDTDQVAKDTIKAARGRDTDEVEKVTLKDAKKHTSACKCASCMGGRVERKSGGRTKGKTNIVINVMPHNGAAKPPMPMPMPMPMPPVAAPPPMGGMPPPGPMHMPPGLGDAMAGAAGAPPPMPPQGMPMARKAGGKVYPIHTGAGGAKARLDKIKAYGLEQK